MVANYDIHGFKLTAAELPESCTACPFWMVNIKTLEDGECFITGTKIAADGPQDEKRMDDCPIECEGKYRDCTDCALDKIRAEIGKSKTEHEMQIAEKDIKAKLLISDIYCDIVNILDKYKAGSEET